MSVLVRLVLLTTFVAGVFGLIVYYDSTAPNHEPYPSPTEINDAYGQHVGEQVLLWGKVQSTALTDDRATISVVTATEPMELTVSGFDTSVEPGGNVQVFGRLSAGHTIDATNVVVVNPAGSSATYKYVVSVAGALLVLVQFLRHWRFDTDAVAFEVRSDG